MPSNPLPAAEPGCSHLCVDFALGIDARDEAKVLDLFAPDGVLITPVKTFVGRDGIEGFLRGRPAAVVTRHLCTNIRITAQADGTATGLCYVLLFRTQTGTDPVYPLKTPTPLVAEYHDTYVHTPAGWRIRERRIQPVFDPLDNPAAPAR